MPEQTGGEKTLPASPQKRQKAREEGRVPRSQDLSGAAAILAALMILRYFGPMLFGYLVQAMAYYFGEADRLMGELKNIQVQVIHGLYFVGIAVGPFLLGMLLFGVTMNLLQVGFLVSGKALMPKLEKLNPLTGLANLFTVRSFVELIKSILKVFLCSYIVWITLRHRTEMFLALMELPVTGLLPAVGALIFAAWWRVALAMLVLGILDYGFQRWQFERDLMMTHQEVKEEMREFEGDPRIRQRVRQIQRQLAMQRMMGEVPKAEVVVTNPTEFAVALRYDAATMAAPVVVAKGTRLVAERIRDIAMRHDVPIVQKPELARALYRTIEVGNPVPADLFKAVAEVLAYVYRIDRRTDKIQERSKRWSASSI